MTDIFTVIKYAMKMEKDAQNFYSYYYEKVSSDNIKVLFQQLVDMEKEHYLILETMLDKLGFKNPPMDISWVVDRTQTELNPSMFSDNAELLKDNHNIYDLSVIRLAYLMENDFALFYRKASESMEQEDAKNFLKYLENWEKSHAEILRNKYEAILKQHWGDVTSLIFN